MKLFGMKNFEDLMKLDAPDDGGGGTGSGDGDNKGGDDGKGGDPNKEKTFTQEDINRIAANEKAQGKKSVLKDLGFEDEDSAKKAFEDWKKFQDSQKTEAEKAKEEKDTALKEAQAAKERADMVEQKLEAIKAGATPTLVDDLIVLARIKMSDTVNFAQALEEVKKTYPNFFGAEGTGSGTGSPGNPARKQTGKDGVEGIGKRLAQGKSQPQGNKNPYFTNN